jgi:hypothetical protein
MIAHMENEKATTFVGWAKQRVPNFFEINMLGTATLSPQGGGRWDPTAAPLPIRTAQPTADRDY